MSKKIFRFSGKGGDITPSQLLAEAMDDVENIEDIVIIRKDKETGDTKCSVSATSNESVAFKRALFSLQVDDALRRDFI